MDIKTKAFACFNKNLDIRRNSSSGGIYFLLAREVIKQQGIVYAVCYDEKFEAIHREIYTEDEIISSLGSKYIPSRLGDTFKKIKRNLLSGKWVLFVGTPCQCAGLQKYLCKDYDTLICVDFVCHGVPSRTAWRKYLSLINSNNSLLGLNMRDKSSGWSKYQYSWNIQYNNKKDSIISQNRIPFMTGFTSNLYLRPSCYECKFKGINRLTDITLGDYWGVWDIQPEMDDNQGTSLVLIHSEKGKNLFESIRNQIDVEEAFLEKAIQYNPSMISSAVYTYRRDQFFEKLFSGENFDQIIKELTQQSFKNKLKSKGKQLIKKIVKREMNVFIF